MKRILIWAVLLVALFGAYCEITGYRPVFLAPYWPVTTPAPTQQTGRRNRLPDEPIAVLAEKVKIADVPVNVEAIGTAQALNTVVVRSQIDGRLIEVDFQEGQDVKAGDILARIDPATFQAQYDQAVAKKAQDEALLANARVDLERYSKLAASQYTSRQQADTQSSTVAQYEAAVRADQGAIDNYKAILDYTVIRAPMDGRAGLRAIDKGNILHSTDTNGLVTVTQLKPIAVIFNLPQQHVRAAVSASMQGQLAVSVLDADNLTELDQGHVTLIDNQVDQTTGTVKFKAEFPNKDLQLWPGQFVNVRVAVAMLNHVMVVPTVAVQRGPTGAFLYRVNEDSTVTQVNVTVTRQDEKIAVVTGDLAEGQSIVSSGFARLKDGAKVKLPDVVPGAATDGASAPGSDAAKTGQKRRKKDAAATEAPKTP